MSTGQSPRGIFSIRIPSSQIILVWVKLTKTKQDTSSLLVQVKKYNFIELYTVSFWVCVQMYLKYYSLFKLKIILLLEWTCYV